MTPAPAQVTGPASRRVARGLALIALLTAVVFQPGTMGSVDVEQRLQVARSWWTSEPEVDSLRYRGFGFGIPGRDGKLHAWWGMGQSVVMFPLDVAASAVLRLSPWLGSVDRQLDGNVRRVLVAYLYQSGITVACVLVAWRLLLALGFTSPQAIAGVLSLLFGTTVLHYVQNGQETTLNLVLTMTGLWGGLQWIQSGSRRHLLAASAALGFDILVRLTTIFDVVAVIFLLIFLIFHEDNAALSSRERLREFASVAGPVLLACVVVERAYQYLRFGNFLGTYLRTRGMNSSLPASFPFNGRFADGFLGALFSPEASIFLFDPLLVVSVVCGVLCWPALGKRVRAYFVCGLALLLAQITLVAKHYDWSGAVSWGDRYTAAPVQLLALLGIPLLIRTPGPERIARALLAVLAVAAFAVQLASTFFPMLLESGQQDRGMDAHSRIDRRVRNIAAYVEGGRAAWPLTVVPEAWASPNYAPFMIRQRLPRLYPAALGIWLVLILALVIRVFRFLHHSVWRRAT